VVGHVEHETGIRGGVDQLGK